MIMTEQYVVCYAYIVDDPCDGRNSEGALLKERAAGQLEQLAQSVAGSLQEHRQIHPSLYGLTGLLLPCYQWVLVYACAYA